MLHISSLYTNISYADTVTALGRALEDHRAPHLPPIDIMIQILQYGLQNNMFTFNEEIFQQLHEVVMGTKLAPALATIYLAQIDDYTALATHTPIIWVRYINDTKKKKGHMGGTLWTHLCRAGDELTVGHQTFSEQLAHLSEQKWKRK